METSEHPNEEDANYRFGQILDELESRGSSASEAAPALARAIASKRRDSVMASKALIAMGSSAISAIPYLLQNLENSREEVRLYSVFVLGVIGEPARCTIPEMASLLWDEEAYVRSATAGALSEITSIQLVDHDTYKLDPSIPGGVFEDEPEGDISGIARDWWLKTGQNTNWPTEGCEQPK